MPPRTPPITKDGLAANTDVSRRKHSREFTLVMCKAKVVQQLLPRVKSALTARDITAPRGALRDIRQDMRTRGNCCRGRLVVTRLHNTTTA
eukprot:9217260-Pyramimonas_sp.AAC.1